MKLAFFVMLLALGMASSAQEDNGDIQEVGVGFSFLCAASYMLAFYAPLHTIAWCILNADQGWKACGEEVLVMLGTSLGMATSCFLV